MAPPTTMRAIQVKQFGGPEELKITSLPVPQPTGNQLLIQVKAIGVNPVETYIRKGIVPGKTVPYIPGTDAAGIVVGLGPDAKGFKIGDRVFTCDTLNHGNAYAEYTVVSTARTFPLPDNLTFSQGAALGVPYFSALRSLHHKAHAKAGDRVLVHGASGGVGIAAVQIGKGWNLDIVGTASTEEGSRLVKSAGARLVLNHRDADHKAHLTEATSGKGFDVILEMTGQANLATDIDVAAQFGRVVIIGGNGDVSVAVAPIFFKEVLVTGILLPLATEAEWKEMGEDIAKLFKTGAIQPVIDTEFPFEKAPQAHTAQTEHAGGSKGKIVLVI